MKNNNYKRHLEKINPPKYFINGMTLRKYCRENNIPFGTIQRRLAKGMSVEEALKYNKLIKYEEYLASEKYIKHLEEKIKIYERKEKQHTKDSILYNDISEAYKQSLDLLMKARFYLSQKERTPKQADAVLDLINLINNMTGEN